MPYTEAERKVLSAIPTSALVASVEGEPVKVECRSELTFCCVGEGTNPNNGSVLLGDVSRPLKILVEIRALQYELSRRLSTEPFLTRFKPLLKYVIFAGTLPIARNLLDSIPPLNLKLAQSLPSLAKDTFLRLFKNITSAKFLLNHIESLYTSVKSLADRTVLAEISKALLNHLVLVLATLAILCLAQVLCSNTHHLKKLNPMNCLPQKCCGYTKIKRK